jgi:putative transposase
LILTERHLITPKHKHFKEIDNLSFLSKNLYNQANYRIRQAFTNKENPRYVNFYEIQRELQNKKQIDYISLPTKVSQQILIKLHDNWNSFFKANKDYSKTPSKYLGKPKLPKYKDIKNGRNIVIYTSQAISSKELKNGIIKLSKSNVRIKTKVKDTTKIKEVRIIPRLNSYYIEVAYEIEEKIKEHKDKEIVMGIDLGVNNLCTIATTNNDKLLINGRPLKSMNQYYNKKKADLQSRLPKNQFKSKQLTKLTNKRNNKIDNYLHKTSKFIIDYCLTNNVDKIVVGKNINWKQEVNIGKKNNQNFVNIPHARLIQMIEYKAKLEGIEFIVTTEEYTSKCSFIDNEIIGKHDEYCGKRIKRGLFKTKEDYLINADINGAFNILRKATPNFNIQNIENGVEVTVVSPLKVTL